MLVVSLVAGCGSSGRDSNDATPGGNSGGQPGEPGAGVGGTGGMGGDTAGPPAPALDGRMTPPPDFDPTQSYAWDPPPADITVDALVEGQPGAMTLERALTEVPTGGVIRIDPSLAGAVLETSGPLEVDRSLTLDASQAPGFTLDGGGADGGIRVGRDLHVRLVGLTIRNVVTDQTGGGVYVDQADGEQRTSVEVIGCLFENNRGAAAGGLYVRRRIDAVVRDSVFRGNVAVDGSGDDLGKGGGAISTRAEGSLRIERVVFTRNDGPEAGAVYSIGQGVTVVHAVFLENGGVAGNGAMLTDGGSVTLDGVLVKGNHGEDFGGAVQLYGYGDYGDHIVVRRSVFLDNWTTNDKGGAAYLTGAEIELDSAIFVRNQSNVDAGAIYFPGSGPVRITNSIFGENECTERSGAGFRMDAGGPVTIEDSMFVSNRAGESGGAFWLQPVIEGSVTGTIFSDNEVGQFVSAGMANGGDLLFFPIRDNPEGPFAEAIDADPLLSPLEEKNGVWWYPMANGSPAAGLGAHFPETAP